MVEAILTSERSHRWYLNLEIAQSLTGETRSKQHSRTCQIPRVQ